MKKKNKITQEEEIRTLLKLNNQYADSYNLLLVENKQIKQEMANLKANLKINKTLVDTLYNNHPSNPCSSTNTTIVGKLSSNVKVSQFNISSTEIKQTIYNEKEEKKESEEKEQNLDLTQSNEMMIYMVKLKEENSNLQLIIDNKSMEYNDLLTKYKLLENSSFQLSQQLKSQISKLTNDCFLLENKLILAENKEKEFLRNIKNLNKYYVKEIYVISPENALLLLNNEYDQLKSSSLELLEIVKYYKEKISSLALMNDIIKGDNYLLKRKVQIKTKECEELRKLEKARPENNLNLSFTATKSKYSEFEVKKIVRKKSSVKNTILTKEILFNDDEVAEGKRAKNRKSLTGDIVSIQPFSTNKLLNIYNNKDYIANVYSLDNRHNFANNIFKDMIYEKGMTYKDLFNLRTYEHTKLLFEVIDELINEVNKRNVEYNILKSECDNLKNETKSLNNKMNLMNRNTNTLEKLIREGSLIRSPIMKKVSNDFGMSPSFNFILENMESNLPTSNFKELNLNIVAEENNGFDSEDENKK